MVLWCGVSVFSLSVRICFSKGPWRHPDTSSCETFVISRAQAMDVLCDNAESPWFRVLSGMVFLITAGYRDKFFLSLQNLHLGEK